MAQDRPTPHMAPAHVPRWLRWLLPGVEEVRDNPLYIRLSGRGFRGGRSRFFAPTLQEYAARKGRGWFGGGITTKTANFFRNAVAEPWGDELVLTRLEPREIDRALIAASMDGASVRMLVVTLIMTAAAVIASRYVTALGVGDLGSAEFRLFVVVALVLSAIYSMEMLLMSALRILLLLRWAEQTIRVGELGAAVRGSGMWIYILMGHGLGLLCVSLWLVAMIFVEVLDLASLAPWMLWAGAIAALLVPSFPAEIAIVRQLYAENDGQLGRALAEAIRSDRKP